MAVDVFNRYPKAQKVSVTSDGQAFITDLGENAAKNHATKNRYGKELQVFSFTREGVTRAEKKEAVTDSKEKKTSKNGGSAKTEPKGDDSKTVYGEGTDAKNNNPAGEESKAKEGATAKTEGE